MKKEKDNSPSLEKDREIFLGQVLYYEKRNKKIEIDEAVVKKIGRKYFYVEASGNEYRVNKKTLKYEDKPFFLTYSYQLYRTKGELESLRKKNILFQMLNKHFDFFGDGRRNSLEQLEEVADVLGLSQKILNSK